MTFDGEKTLDDSRDLDVDFKKEYKNLKEDIEQNAPIIDATFELLSDANMPSGINRYRIVKKAVNGQKINGMDIMGNFFECANGSIDFKFVNGSKLDDYNIGTNGNNKTALVMPLPFVSSNGTTEGLTIMNGKKTSGEVKNYWGDNAVVWFKDGKSGIIKVNITDGQGKTNQSNETINNAKIVASNTDEQSFLEQILNEKNGYSVCQQISIMNNGNRSCNYVGQTPSAQVEGGGRRYRFYVETNGGKIGVVDFKEDITINQAIAIMKNNGIKNAVYADIIAYNIYFGDKNGQFYTREEGNDGESSYEKVRKNLGILPNKNSIIMRGE